MGTIRELPSRPMQQSEHTAQPASSSSKPINLATERYRRIESYDARKRASQQRQREEETASGIYVEILADSTVMLEAVRVFKARKANKEKGRIQSVLIEAGAGEVDPSSLPDAVFFSSSAEKMKQDRAQLLQEAVDGDPDGPDFT